MCPRTADGDAFRFRAGRLSLDLCSTLLWRHVDAVDLLRTPQDLLRWLAEAGVLPVPDTAMPRELEAAIALREAVYALALERIAGRALPAPELAVVNDAATAPNAVPRLTSDGAVAYQAPEAVQAALSLVARDAIAVLAADSPGRLKQCAAPDCAFLFVDVSPAGNRRWCAPNRCGNREHVRQHRRRRG